MHVFICENTPNGILTGVYDAWELKIHHPLKMPEKLFLR